MKLLIYIDSSFDDVVHVLVVKLMIIGGPFPVILITFLLHNVINTSST